jgi:sigma-54 dependent transcriptional regulator, acetoin dehydrogenase operon transcriptional activator AcoR
LNNALQTACALVGDTDACVDWEHLPDDLAEDLRCMEAPRPEVDEAADLRLQADRTVKQVVEACPGNLSEAARRLGISRNTLYRKLRGRAPAA